MTDIAMTAKQIMEAGVPDLLNRWLTLTPERLAEDEATRRRNTTQQWRRPMTTKIGAKEQALRDATAANAKAAVADEAAPKTDPKPAASAPAKPDRTATVKTTQTKAKPTATATAKKPTTARRPAAKPAKPATKAAGKTMTAKAPTKGNARANARTPVADRPDGLRDGSKQAVMLDLALHEDGATEQAICHKLGWKKCRVTLKRVCDKVGAKLETKKNVKDETVFFATMPKSKAS